MTKDEFRALKKGDVLRDRIDLFGGNYVITEIDEEGFVYLERTKRTNTVIAAAEYWELIK